MYKHHHYNCTRRKGKIAMEKKKWSQLLMTAVLSVMLVFGLAACSDNDTNVDTVPGGNVDVTTPDTNADDDVDVTLPEGDTDVDADVDVNAGTDADMGTGTDSTNTDSMNTDSAATTTE